MYLNSFSVSGFRSLTDVREIPVRKPTILAGHNDGGKSAVLDSLHFLTGSRKLKEDDRTFVARPGGGQELTAGSRPQRCEETLVVGEFQLDEWEQAELELPALVQIRRRAGQDCVGHLEYWGSLPDDGRLRDVSSLLVTPLKALVKEYGLEPASSKKEDLQKALRSFARKHSSGETWLPAPSLLNKRMPRLLPFDGKVAHPDAEIKSALSGRFKQYMEDPQLRGKLSELEDEVKDRLRTEAKSLCDHIQLRCPDLTDVYVDPDVSFEHGFRGAPLRVARAAGESVALEGSGLGRSRRVALAVWEWTSELLAEEEEDKSGAPTEEEDAKPPAVQTIVIYDEPDTHLDYHHQRRVMQLIQDQSALSHVAVIVATHSLNLIDGVEISDVVHLKLENHRTVIERIGAGAVGDELEQHLWKIAAGLGLRNSVLLHERCFLAVEGDTEQRAFPLLFKLCEEMSLQAAGIALWACFNNEGALHLARYLAEHERSFMLVVDADSRNLPKSIFKPAKLTQFFGPRAADYVKFIGEPDPSLPGGEKFNELEEAFTDEVWARVANKVWPRTEGFWAPEDFLQLRGGKFSDAVKQMLREQSESGPGGKPDMMYQLASALEGSQDVPEQLRLVFRQLRKLAA